MHRVDNRGPIWQGGVWARGGAPAPGPTLEVAPAVTGTPNVGQTLSASTGTWSGTGTITYARQWLRDGAPIAGATGATYTLVAADDQMSVSCRVTATDDLGSRVAGSNSVAVTYAAPVAAGALADQTLTVDEAITPIDVAADFTGGGMTFALAPSSAALPAGLSLSSAGVITGTPTAITALRSIVVRATNSGGFDDTAFDVTIAAAPVAPVLSGFSITDDGGGAGTVNIDVDIDCTVHVWIGPLASTPTATEVRNGTGADGVFNFAALAAGNIVSVSLPTGLVLGDYFVAAVGQVGTGPLSNVVSLASIAFDTDVPGLSTLSPADNAADVAVDAPLVMTFDEPMDRLGTVTLKVVGGANIETFDLSTDGVWSSGDTVWTGQPAAAFTGGAALAVRWAGLTDANANPLADNATDTAWNFDVVAPAPSLPQINNVTETAMSFTASKAIAVGATTATDTIYVLANYASARTCTPPANFTEVWTHTGFHKTSLYKWDGTGTRPNSSNVTFTLDSAGQINGLAIVLDRAVTETAIVTENDSGFANPQSGPSVTAAANSLVFYIVQNASADLVFTAPTPVPALEGAVSFPTGEINWKLATPNYMDLMTEEFAAGGATPTPSCSRGANFQCHWIVFSVS